MAGSHLQLEMCQPLRFTARHVEFAKPADIQYIIRGGDGAPEQPGAVQTWRPLRQIRLSAARAFFQPPSPALPLSQFLKRVPKFV
jgi:hypothetical protein